ncbi:hypothetical protein Q0590_26770 [Rhodocytophaga aerolata]|uniref:Lipocalin-like domain-containing protein n=1 Tax=Rhodocytophaga aerolata TaxID=455078 RepID=A0ABT8RCS8_9BACT|nr:hypothetical protein [Rhodocytophaga aerolata]MDO1449911.1 hypothetical protein [Rhodocytophaga aerolata]
MKAKVFVPLLIVLMTSFFACKQEDDSPTPGGVTEVGTYAGSIQVSDDPTTKVGYIYNAKVKVTTNGSNATLKITGDPGFDREYTGTFTTQQGLYDIVIKKQTKPTERIAGDRAVISNNKLTFLVDVANESVTARDSPTTTTTLTISGKLKMIGTDMLKE